MARDGQPLPCCNPEHKEYEWARIDFLEENQETWQLGAQKQNTGIVAHVAQGPQVKILVRWLSAGYLCCLTWYLKTSNHSINKHIARAYYETHSKLDLRDTEIKTTVTAVRESITLLPFYSQGLWLVDSLMRVETNAEVSIEHHSPG